MKDPNTEQDEEEKKAEAQNEGARLLNNEVTANSTLLIKFPLAVKSVCPHMNSL